MATIIVEDGTGLPNANSYVSVEELEQYASDRGITISASDPSILLIKAMDWLLVQPFTGDRLNDNQALHFPTVQNGLPENIKRAEMEAALLTDSGFNLLAPLQPRVIQQTVVGAVSRTFSDKGNQSVIFTQLNSLIAPFLLSSGSGFVVSRG